MLPHPKHRVAKYIVDISVRSNDRRLSCWMAAEFERRAQRGCMQKICIVGQFGDQFLLQLDCTGGKWMTHVSWHLVFVAQDYLRRVQLLLGYSGHT